MINYRFIAKSAFAISLVVGAAILASLVYSALVGDNETVPPKQLTLEKNLDRFRFEEYLINLGKYPLAWDCQTGQPDRIRYMVESCATEHIAEIHLNAPGDTGSVLLIARGEANFTLPKSKAEGGHYQLDLAQTDGLRAILARNLHSLPVHSDSWSTPTYRAAIEACIAGKSFLAIRNSRDDAFEKIAEDIAVQSGFKLGTKSTLHCM